MSHCDTKKYLWANPTWEANANHTGGRKLWDRDVNISIGGKVGRNLCVLKEEKISVGIPVTVQCFNTRLPLNNVAKGEFFLAFPLLAHHMTFYF